MGWFQQHLLIGLYLVISGLWALWNIVRTVVRRRRLALAYVVVTILLAPILMPLSLLNSRREPAWMGLRWKCPNCAWAMFEQECEECGATGLPYDPVTHRVLEENIDP